MIIGINGFLNVACFVLTSSFGINGIDHIGVELDCMLVVSHCELDVALFLEDLTPQIVCVGLLLISIGGEHKVDLLEGLVKATLFYEL